MKVASKYENIKKRIWACRLQNVPYVSLHWRHNGCDGVSNHQPHDCLLNRLFKVQIKENIKAPCHWPLCGEFTGDRWIPRTNGQSRGKCFHLMTSSCSKGFGLMDNYLPHHRKSRILMSSFWKRPLRRGTILTDHRRVVRTSSCCDHKTSRVTAIGFGDYTDLLWWNDINNKFCQLTTRVRHQRGIRVPFKCTENHTYWG